MSSSAYRPDIDGLRAIAVLAVVLYHFGIGGLRGGFVGVDVFFVISGYLIAGIIQAEIRRGEFTLARFYERRARRLFPALFVVLLATLVAGVFLLLPSDLVRLGRATVATVLFVSNVQFMRESGYFDASSDFNPLLHTWSLGVEEQFYLGLPLLLLLVHRFVPRHIGKVLAICALVSFALCVVVQPIIAKLVFFLSPFRAWELLLGALLGVGVVPAIRSSRVRDLLSVVGLGVLLGSVAFMREGVDFPGWKAALPVAATALLLHAGQAGDSACARMLSVRPLVYIGLISYSMYLWHWPLLVYARYWQGMDPLPLEMALLLLVVSLLLAAASYHLVEKPFRHARVGGGAPARRRVFAASAISSVLLIAFGWTIVRAGGLPARVPPGVFALDVARLPTIPYKQCDGQPPSRSSAECLVGDSGRGELTLIWGDSWALAWTPALDQVLKREGKTGVLALHSGCAPLPGVSNLAQPNCLQFNAQVLEWIQQNRPARVYLIAAWPSWANQEGGYPLEDVSGKRGNAAIFAEAYPRAIESLRPHAMEIVVVGPTPGAPKFLPYRLAVAKQRSRPPPAQLSRAAFDMQARHFWRVAGQTSPGVSTVDPGPWFCDQVDCRYEDDRGNLLYRDGNHISLAGARLVADRMGGIPPGTGAGCTFLGCEGGGE